MAAASSTSPGVAREAQAGELPARVGRKEIAVARADVARGRGAGSAAQRERMQRAAFQEGLLPPGARLVV